MAHRMIGLLIILIILVLPTNLVVDADPNQKDDDESGITHCRDDDGLVNTYRKIGTSGDWARKRLWVYYDDYFYSDIIRLYIYGSLSAGTRDISIDSSHELIIDGCVVTKFRTSDYFHEHAYVWHSFSIGKEFLQPNSCAEIVIKSIAPLNKEDLWIGVDNTFYLKDAGDNPNNYQDFQRSNYKLLGLEYTPEQVEGEFMIYFEFYDIDYDKSIIHDETKTGEVILEESVQSDTDADSCGITFDWSQSMSTQEFNDIYTVRLYLFGISRGLPSTTVNNIELRINDADGSAGRVIEFNSFKRFNKYEWTWSCFEITNVGEKADWLIHGVNYIDIYDTDTLGLFNNLGIATTKFTGSEILDRQDSWWYFWDEDKNPEEFTGEWREPQNAECDENIIFVLEVYKARKYNERGNSKLYELGMGTPHITEEDYEWDQSGVNDLYNDFTSNGYESLFFAKDEYFTQWRFYGERRSKFDLGGDLADILIYNGDGEREIATLPYFYCGLYSDIGEVYNHRNEDLLDFTSRDVTCSEAEGNDDHPSNIYYIENVGSDGFDFDTEWLILFYCSCLKSHDITKKDNSFQTLLWHGMHAVFGFINVIYEEYEVIPAMKDFFEHCWGDEITDPKTIYDAFREICTDYTMPGYYYYHTSNDDDYIWGVDGENRKVTEDVIIRTDIDRKKYSDD